MGLALLLACSTAFADEGVFEIERDALADKIQGGLLGQIFGNLNGLPHELKYNDRPGNVVSYVPALPEGAWTDDDTDIEWVHIWAMQQGGEVFLSRPRQVELWKQHINGYIWCANNYARKLMDLGLEPPLTGRIAFNPWSEFNISGQFCCEAYGLIAPGMPQTASKIGLHYTHITIDGEPAQTSQLFDTMIATAFVETDIPSIIDAGLSAVDPKSVIHDVVVDVKAWHKDNPSDWRKTWYAIHDRYARHGGMRDYNGHELNTAAIIASLLYGQGDFTETLRHAFNFGWDADCNAATAGTVVGVIKGRRWMEAQGWLIVDRYRNVARPGLPDDETITRYGERLVDVAMMVLRDRGGVVNDKDGQKVVRIQVEKPANVEPLPRPVNRLEELRNDYIGGIRRDLTGAPVDRARTAYMALCLNEWETLAQARPDDWSQAIATLQNEYPQIVDVLFKAPEPTAKDLQARARSAGLKPPSQ